MEYERPKNKRSLQRFLGMCNYDRMFIKNITEKIAPLYKLLTKDSKFIWDEKHDETFRNVKELWKKELNLYLPDFSKEFYLETDASKIGLGAVLRQENGPIAYISRSLSNAEKKYSITEREVLAAIWAMEKFTYYLRGRKFKLTTDHKAMCELKNKLEFGSYRVQRWFDRIERFDFEIEYKKGSELIASDALSRSPPGEVAKEGEEVVSSIEVIDEKILNIHKRLNHRKSIEFEIEKELGKVSKNKIKKVLEKCLICAMKDKSTRKTCHYIEVSRPGEKLGIDILEIDKNERIVVAIDYFRRYVFAKLIKTKERRK